MFHSTDWTNRSFQGPHYTSAPIPQTWTIHCSKRLSTFGAIHIPITILIKRRHFADLHTMLSQLKTNFFLQPQLTAIFWSLVPPSFFCSYSTMSGRSSSLPSLVAFYEKSLEKQATCIFFTLPNRVRCTLFMITTNHEIGHCDISLSTLLLSVAGSLCTLSLRNHFLFSRCFPHGSLHICGCLCSFRLFDVLPVATGFWVARNVSRYSSKKFCASPAF